MNKKRFRKTGLHWVKQGASFSLVTILLASTILGSVAGSINPQTTLAAEGGDLTIKENQDIRVLRYFKDCLNTYLNTSSGGGFKGYDELFTEDGKQERIAVGIDLDKTNGMWTCDGVARRALAVYKPDEDDSESYLMKTLWGKTRQENGGAVKVSAATVKNNRNSMITNINNAIVSREKAGSSRRANLKRFTPLLNQCFQKWSDKDFEADPKDPDHAIVYPARKIYAERKEFDWRALPVSIRSVGQGGPNSIGGGSNGYIGSIELNFQTKTGLLSAPKFSDRESDWFPIGNDLGESVVGSKYYKNHSGQTFLDCNWVKAQNEYLFGQSNKYFFAVQNDKLGVYDKDGNGDVRLVEEVATNTNASGDGSNNYQCIVEPPLSWIACPVITTVVNGIEVLEGAIVEAVQVPPLTTDGPFEGLHTTWAGFRDLANAFLVLIFLIAIFAQVLPLEIDPYMVKKVLPKLIAAAIFIQFSYFFVQVMFDISRVLGQGVTTLIDSIPVSDIGGGAFGQDIGNTTATSTLGLLGTIAVGGAGIAAVATAGLALAVPVVLLLIAGLLSVVTLFVTLQVRMIVIIIFTILSPLAFLAWILPNTENYFKKWITGLMKLLLMYPIIVFMVQGVNVISNISYEALAAMAGANNGGAGGVSLISKIMVSVIPIIVYFMIPMTFKWAGGIFGSISGAIQGQGNRMGKRLRSGSLMKNSMEGLKQKTGERLASTEKFGWGDLKNPGRYGSGMKRLGARVATGNAFSFGRTGARKLAQTANTARHAKLEAQVATVKDLNAGNDVIGEMIAARLAGKETYTYTDRAGETRSVKLSDDMVAGGIKYLNDNGGQIELAKIGNGHQQYKVQNPDGTNVTTTDRSGNKVDVTTTGPAAFVPGDPKGPFQKLGKGGKFAMGEIFKEATDGNVAALMKAAPHLVHGKKEKLYTEANGDVFAGIKGESMDVARQVIVGDAKAEANFADALVDIMNSSTKSGGMDKETARKMQDMIQNTSVGDQEINLGNGLVPLRSVMNQIFTVGGKVAYNDNAKRTP